MQCSWPGLLTQVTLLEFVGLERWAEIRSSARGAGGLGVPQGGSCYSEGTPRESKRELYKLKAGLLVYAAGRPRLWLSATPP